MPNALAYVALFAWPVVALAMFRRMAPRRALIWTLLAGYLLLPERTGVDLPLLPALDKTFIPAAAALALCWPHLRARGGLGVLRGPMGALAAIYLAGPFATALSNPDPVITGVRFMPGLNLYDAASSALTNAVLLMPYLLARRMLADEDAHRDLLTALAAAGLAYTLPALFEIRMSPQLHSWIYGFFPHAFDQQMRYGGFRPVVFLPHGLWLAMFMAMAVIAAAALWRLAPQGRRAARAAATAWLLGVLVLCKTLSATFYALAFAPLVRFAPLRWQVLAAALAGGAVLLYPMLRGADLAPTQTALELAAAVDEERAQSLGFRLGNEDVLLARANLRPFLGWGGYGRSHEYDPATGRDLTIADGRWIIVIGAFGWLGYLAEFGLLTLPLILAARRRAPVAPATAALGLILAANLIDLIPNASLTPLTWMIAGALAGRLEAERARRPT
ncbi:hypothetical protein [Oceanicella actignis]|uniref:hypothetical protein n=1 Tax=Oceanicella actignis TaxID=1189325 RepID=UPI0011E61668|nr:hypothetical protein [Oceanicella actignis]TYO88749.1 hypothetical protein LY05_01902 [Oceanicella actignis]